MASSKSQLRTATEELCTSEAIGASQPALQPDEHVLVSILRAVEQQ